MPRATGLLPPEPSKSEIERMIAMYPTRLAAARALNMDVRKLRRLCAEHGIAPVLAGRRDRNANPYFTKG